MPTLTGLPAPAVTTGPASTEEPAAPAATTTAAAAARSRSRLPRCGPTLIRTTESLEDPSSDRHPRSAPDTELSNVDPPRCRVAGPSTSDTECLGRTPRPEAVRLGPRDAGL